MVSFCPQLLLRVRNKEKREVAEKWGMGMEERERCGGYGIFQIAIGKGG